MTLTEQNNAPALAAPSVPDGPLSFLQHLRVLRQSSIATFSAKAYSAEILERRLLWKRSFLVNEPNAIKHILLGNAANYRKTEIMRRMLEPGLGRGLLTSEGEMWRRHRRIMAPAFDHSSIINYSAVTTETVEESLAAWDALPMNTEVDVAAEMMRMTLNIISRTMFSSDSEDAVDIVERTTSRYQAEMRPGLVDLLGLPAWMSRLSSRRRVKTITADFDRLIDRLLLERERSPNDQPKDLLGRLIAARDEETGRGMTTEEVRNQVITIFTAGHETTAMALTWTLYLLAQHPAIEQRLHAELASGIGRHMPRHEDLAKLPYVRMVIEEAMRLYPPVPVMSRTAIGVDEVSGRHIPAGSQILIAPWLVHRNPKLWDAPERFDPERFAPERATHHRFAYIPFGAGPRICIGAALALAQATLILATIAVRYRFLLKPGIPVEPQGLITLRPRHGMRMILERRY
jgi:cytochrome P450